MILTYEIEWKYTRTRPDWEEDLESLTESFQRFFFRIVDFEKGSKFS